MMDKIVYEILSSRVPKPLPFIIRKEREKYLVKAVASSDIISLNELAGNILLKITGKDNIDHIMNDISAEYENVEITVLHQDVFNIINQLEKCLLIKIDFS